jgi:hypothetical protein
MNLPSFGLHPLKGKRAGYWSVSVSGNWRIIRRQCLRHRFRRLSLGAGNMPMKNPPHPGPSARHDMDGDAYAVEIVDYH